MFNEDTVYYFYGQKENLALQKTTDVISSSICVTNQAI